jgi:hypothetical protein
VLCSHCFFGTELPHKLQGVVDTATSTLAGLDDALSMLEQQKAEAESQLAAERERVERAAAADKLDKQVRSAR